MKNHRSALISLLVLLTVIAVALSAVAGVYGDALDQHFGFGQPRVFSSGHQERAAVYYDALYQQDMGEQGTLTHANRVSKQITDEGIVLLKNSGILPLAKGTAVTPFGLRFLLPVYSGTGSGQTSVNQDYVYTPEAGLSAYFSVNAASAQAMQKGKALRITKDAAEAIDRVEIRDDSAEVYEYPGSVYQGIVDTCQGSVGIVFLGRIGGESAPYPTSSLADGTAHVLALTQAEREAFAFSKQYCDATIAVINSANVMEIGELTHGPLECDAILWIGNPGNTGFQSLGDILAGRVNPSGRTPDIWDADLLANPVQANFCDRIYENTRGVVFSSNYDGTNNPAGLYYIEYEEGIYVGYRYYETADALGALPYGRVDETGRKTLDGAVNYPFGYGLSYTAFSQRILRLTEDPSSGRVTVTVQVTNHGCRAGKETVQLYSQPPYTDFDRDMGIEKAAKNLIVFDKIALNSGETGEVALSFLPEELASYCMAAVNPDRTQGCYCLEQGEYQLILGKNSHDAWDSIPYVVGETVYYHSGNPRQSERLAQAGSAVAAAVNRFDDVTAYMMEEGMTLLSRADWAGTQPTAPETKSLSPDRLSRAASYDPFTDPFTGNVGLYTKGSSEIRQSQPQGLTLADMRGRDYEDPLWDAFLDQLDYSENGLWDLLLTSSFHTAAVTSIGKPRSLDRDGPQGLHGNRGSSWQTYAYCAEVVLAATFNQALAEEFGKSIGNEALLIGLTGWYGPGLNIHRSAFGGRNFEYFSEDALLSGKIAARCVSGAASRGVVCYMKHFALNNYEGPSTCLTVWATEQTIRETYLRSFEIVVKEAMTQIRYYGEDSENMQTRPLRAALGVMGAANCIGTEWCAANYALLQQVLRGEWGFQGVVITDMALQRTDGCIDKIFRNGGDLRMYYYSAGLLDKESPAAMTAFRRAVKNICYAYANSNLMQGLAPGASVRYALAPWRIVLIVFSALVSLADAVLVVILWKEKQKFVGESIMNKRQV